MQNKTEHTFVNGINLEPNKKLGYYLVNNEIYYSKFQALTDAFKKNQTVKWFFNEHAFMQFPWHVEPEESLEELYRQRAQQLRDEYDYIRVECSGGSDSAVVVFSFLLNNIPLDEVVFRYPKKGDAGVSGNAIDIRPENTLSEWEFAAKPLLEWIAVHSPSTKITVHDYSENIIKEADTKDESWIFRTRHYLQPSHVNKYDAVGHYDHRLLAERDQRICILYGADKPKICIKDGKFFIYFNDAQASMSDQTIGDYTNMTNEYFYWSPDACRLLAKQAHTIKNWFEQPEHHNLQHLLQWPNSNFASRTIYEQIVKALIYTDYDLSTFQTNKPTNNIWNEMDHWFHVNFKNTPAYSVWQAGIDYLVNNIDQTYVGVVQGEIKNIMMFESPYYCIGDSSIVKPVLPAVAPGKDLAVHKVTAGKTHQHVINGKLVIY